jgi:hypothetical protein
MKKGMVSIATIIAIFLFIVIATALLPTVADQTIGIDPDASNITGVNYTLISLVPLFYIIGLLLVVLGAFKVSGKI